MEVIAKKLSRKFANQTVIRELNFRFEAGASYAILGGNGSGKSTILKLVYGALTPSSGNLTYRLNGIKLKQEQVPFHITIAGPYLELIEELSAREFLDFYFKFRKPVNGFGSQKIIKKCMLEDAATKEIRNFSSGMKQRLRLGLAFFTQSDMVLLDEPTSNLDAIGIEWYRKLVEESLLGRTLLVGSNHQEKEMDFCHHHLESETWR